MREIWFCMLAAFAILGLAAGPAQAAGPASPLANAQALLAVAQTDRILGKPDAPVTIIEYASLTCPHCAHFETEVLPTIRKNWIDPGKAKLVLRDFPLDGEALKAAMIARCAPAPRFYAFIETFFADQDNWVPAKDVDAALTRLAKLGGMGPDEVASCLKNKTLENQILESRLTANKELGVNATPTFFINGHKFEGAPTVEALSADLQSAYAQVAPGGGRHGAAAAPANPAAAAINKPAPAAAAATAQSLAVPAAAPAPTIWSRVRGWFHGMFGSTS